MKACNIQIIFCFTFLVASLTACVKETEYNTYIQDYLDSISIVDTVPVDIDMPCSTPTNMIYYGAYDHEFTIISCNYDDDLGFKVTGTNPGDNVTLILTFKSKPLPGKYITDYYYGNPPTSDSKAVVQYNTYSDHYIAVDGDTLYVEKLSGGTMVFSFCDLQIDAGWGGYFADCNLSYNLAGCD